MGNKKSILIIVLAMTIILGCLAFVIYNRFHESPLDQKMERISFNDVHLFMNRAEVGKMYGLGSDKTPYCFGCELNFIFPQIKLSGRYSETLDRRMEGSKSPKVKLMTTADPANEALGVRVGDTFEQAARKLETEGLHGSPNGLFSKGRYSIQLWLDGDIDDRKKNKNYEFEPNDKIGSITVGYRVESDEKIVY
ncbi:hypothetical protein D7Z26_02320 [Cohnella endophytica]|uniref:Uncharacterized protein n=1 Tax=Cohnella endophytica TaxID=2419778 RepID=A0A494Y5Q3_9BACL|nr:hypothetical protein [Cohnella endophytica]RKP56845.1 hypothetical protein D7Z26_02320 [Cohnella endophytica]